MNCTYPLSTSLLMDVVPAKSRARWQSLNSVVRFGWCGSAAVGGILADKYGYAKTFLFTAGLQTVGLCVLLTVYPLVPRMEKSSPPAPQSTTVSPLPVGCDGAHRNHEHGQESSPGAQGSIQGR